MAMEAEEKSRDLAQKVAQATYEQLASQIEADIILLRKQLPTPKCQAVETALDMKYARERQMILANKFIDNLFNIYGYHFGIPFLNSTNQTPLLLCVSWVLSQGRAMSSSRTG